MTGGRVIRGLKAAADILLPRVCIVCGRKLLLGEEHICLFCQSDIPLTRHRMLKHNPMADRFNELIQRQVEADLTDSDSDKIIREKYAYALALFFYDSDSDYRHIPYQIKYHGNVSAGRHFGQMLGCEVAATSWLADVDAIIPVPLHWRRKWSRGYNQAEIIARAVSDITGVPVRTDILKRVRYTGTQTKMDVPQKAENVDGAFCACRPEDAAFRHIVLIDDVFTSGSTLGACFKALREVFPASVRISVATLAYVGGA